MIDLYDETKEIQNITIFEVSKQNMLNYLRTSIDEISYKLQALHKLHHKNRLSPIIVPFDEFNNLLKTLNVADNQELPYQLISEYYHNLPVTQSFENNILKLTVNVLLVEKFKRDLFLIEQFPTVYKSSLQVTKVMWKCIAKNEEAKNVVTMKDLSYCKLSTDSVYLCRAQFPLINIDKSKDCAINSLKKNKIDAENCKLSVFRVNNLLLIKLTDGEYFYFTPRNETLKINCQGLKVDFYLTENTRGLLNLKQGCVATFDQFTLITQKYNENAQPFSKIDIEYDETELLSLINNKTVSMFDEYTYMDSMNDFHSFLKN